MLKSSIIIPTFNRPKELHDCILSIMKQTVKPYEVIVVDDGNLSILPLKEECEKAGIRYLYYKKTSPGLTESRNVGVKLATGDIIFFLDDDIVLFPDYIEEILKVYEDDKKEEVGGVGGSIANQKPLNIGQRIRRLIDVFFFVSSFHEGKVLLSGFCSNYGTSVFQIKKIKKVDFLSGGVMSYRKEIFKEFSFTDGYRNYGFGEDKDFSFRVSKKYNLFFNPDAKLNHFESPKMRPDEITAGRKYIIGRYLFFKYLVKKSWWHWLFLYYAIFGYTLDRMIIAVIYPKKKNIYRIYGLLCGIKDIIYKDINLS